MMILGKSRGVAVLLTVALGLAAVPAAAQQPAAKPGPTAGPTPAPPPPAAKPDAKALYTSGEKKFNAGDFAGALADFEASQAATASPEAQRNIARSLDNMQRFVDAAAAYDKFLAAVPAKMKAEGEEAKHRFDAIHAMPGHVKVTSVPDAALVAVDGKDPGGSKTPAELDLPAGHHALTLSAEGYEPTTKEIDVTFASKQDVNVELPAKAAPPPPPPVVAENPPPPPPPPPPPEPRSKVPAYVTGAVAIVAAGVGTGFGIKALGQSSDFKDHPTTSKADDGENNALVADMMFGIAITFGVTSAVLFLSSDTPAQAKAPQPKKPTVTAAPYVTPHGGGAGAQVSF